MLIPLDKLRNEEFVKVVKDSISKPEIPVQIITDKENISYTKQDFYEIKAESLKDYNWKKDENLKEIDFSFKLNGLEGSANLAFIEQNGLPVTSIDKLSETVNINGEDYELSMELKYDTNEIRKNSSTIGITDDGEINQSSNYSNLAKSESRLSIHGISYPESLFPTFYSRDKKALIRWSFPMLLVLDVGGKNDLDLNSARNEILHNEKWDYLEQELSYIKIGRASCRERV